MGVVSELRSAFLFLFEAGGNPLIDRPCSSVLGNACSWLLVENIFSETAVASSSCSCCSASGSERGLAGVLERVRNVIVEFKKWESIISTNNLGCGWP